MFEKLIQKISAEKILAIVLIGGILVISIFVFYLFFTHGEKIIRVLSPKGGVELEVGKTYPIIWSAKNVKRVGIVLFNDKKEAKWIAKNLNANLRKYNWKIHLGQEYGDGFWIAVFEYPWRSGNKIAYSKRFAIVYSKSLSCDELSIKNEWPYLPDDLPNLRKVFITKNVYSGNLGGFEGADKICQEEAEKQGLDGKWHAFLGGDKDEETAIERLLKTPRRTEGTFIEAKSAGKLERNKGVTCHRLLGRNFDSFLEKLSSSLAFNKKFLSNEFFDGLKNVWLGRIDKKSKRNCIFIYENYFEHRNLSEGYSFTSSCQNWTKGEKFVDGYSSTSISKKKIEFPNCYTKSGMLVDAVAIGGLSEGIIENREKEDFTPYKGEYCSKKKRLICIEE